MELGVPCPWGAVDVAGGEEALTVEDFVTAGSPAGQAGVALHVAEGGFDRGVVGGGDLGADLRAAEGAEQGDRLRRGEGEIEAGDRFGDVAQPERLAVGRVQAAQHADELVGSDLPVKAELGVPVAEPLTGRLTLARVVVLGAFGDLVAGLARADLADRQHLWRRPRRRSDRSRVVTISPQLASRGGACTGSD